MDIDSIGLSIFSTGFKHSQETRAFPSSYFNLKDRRDLLNMNHSVDTVSIPTSKQ